MKSLLPLYDFKKMIIKTFSNVLILLLFLISQKAFPAVFTVSSSADAGANTLRQAIIDANAAGTADVINFNFGSATTITLASCLPQITGQTTINGYSNPGSGAGNLMIEVISPTGCNGFDFSSTSSGSIIQGLVISGGTTGIYLRSSGNFVLGNYLGTNRAGTAIAASRLQDCINLNGATNCTIGGTGGQIERNIISGATQDGIRLQSSSTGLIVINNYIGTDVTGNVGLGNSQHGIEGYGNSHGTRVGGTTLAEMNVISANLRNGVYLNTCQSPVVKGNIIGMGLDGVTKLGNGSSGIDIQNTGTGSPQIGGLTLQERNYISCNGSFGMVVRYANGTVVQGNWVGVDKATGLLDYGNVDAGITATNTNDIIVGGSVAGSGNIFSANGNPGGGADGISIFSTSPRAIIKGNIIGLGADTITPLQNYGHGIELLTSDDAIIGGTTKLERNYVSCSLNPGLQIVTCPRLKVIGNYIGTDVSGLLDRGNGENGIALANSADVIIGGSLAAERNIISGNTQNGILVNGNSPNVVIKGNIIGLGSDGVTKVGNDLVGIKISGNQTTNSTIGGIGAFEQNIISGNGSGTSHHGIAIDGGANVHSIVNNYIGTDITGSIAKGNAGAGIFINAVNNVTITSNVVSANGFMGIQFTASSNNFITKNKIGTDVTGGLDFGNASDGLNFSGTSTINMAGGTLADANTIAYNNGTAGVVVTSNAQKNTITFNSIFCNKGLGIDLQSTANESVPPPVILFSGPNSVNGTGAGTNAIHVYRNVKADGGVKCDCEGEIYIGTTSVSSGVWSLTHNLGLSTAEAASVTATQTTTNGSTSEFTPCSTPLPVQLVYFDVTKNSDHTVSITWATSSEKNNRYFEILRSEDGIHFYVIGVINGKGNSSSNHEYLFTDTDPVDGLNYYQLKQVDNNGAVAYSIIKQVNFIENKILIVSESDGFSIIVPGNYKGEKLSYQVYSTTGAMVAKGEINVTEQEKIYKIKLIVSEAIYIACVSDGNNLVTEKIMIGQK